MSMYYESKRRSVVKTISWRFFATLDTTLIVFILTGELLLAVSVSGIEIVTKLMLYFFHERSWNKINFGRRTIQPFVLWFTGLSGAGKSTLAELATDYLKKKGLQVQQLDGDKIREIFPNTGFSRIERDRHVRRVGYLASMLEHNNVIVVAALISPYEETRQQVRELCRNFVEVYVDTPLDVCEERDPKKLYQRARAGEIQHFTGIDDPYEPPPQPEVRVRTEGMSVDQSFEEIRRTIDKLLTV